MTMFRNLNSILLSLCSLSIVAQSNIQVNAFLQYSDFAPGTTVTIQSAPGTTPAQSIVFTAAGTGTLEHPFLFESPSGGVIAFSNCGGTGYIADSAYYSGVSADTAYTLQLVMSCGGTLQQYPLAVSGVVSNCMPNTLVTVETLPGTTPYQQFIVTVNGFCQYMAFLWLDSGTGGVAASKDCSGGSIVSDTAYFSYPIPDPTANVVIDLSCEEDTCVPPAIINTPDPITICSSDNSLLLQVSTTGTGPLSYNWTGPASFYPNSTAQAVYVNMTGSGPVHITVANACGTTEADLPILVIQTPDAGNGVDTTMCDILGPTSLFSLLTGAPNTGGTWFFDWQPQSGTFDPGADGAGSYQYIVYGTAPCYNDTATVTITELTTWYDDADGDGLGDPNISVGSCTPPSGYVNNDLDYCPSIFGTIGSACDDGNTLTIYDHLNANCECVGTDSSFVDCLGILGGSNVPGTFCSGTLGGSGFFGNWDANCICQPSTVVDCAGMLGGTALPGTACFDFMGDFGIWSLDCVCVTDTTGSNCNAYFWAVQAYDSTGGWNEPVPNEVWVWNFSSGGNAVYDLVWDFGDGSTSSDPEPSHYYSGPGPWLLCLTLTSGNCTDIYCDSVSLDANGFLNGMIVDGHSTAGSNASDRDGGFTLNVLQAAPTGISDMPAIAELNVWPNPVSNELNVSFNSAQAGPSLITVIGMDGRMVLREDHRSALGSNTVKLNTASLAPGLYMLRIEDGTQRIPQRFLKVR
ncbi:MAG: T9SS type A sorting domain-containing protein [Flavobacteriales bacterium]